MEAKLKTMLTEWNGKHVEYLSTIYRDHIGNVHFSDSLIDLYLSNKGLQRASTWLIKHHYDGGNTLSSNQETKVLSGVDALEHWESKLHILQLIPKFDIDINISEKIEPFVRASLYSAKKFVKAAAFEAYYEIVKQLPELQNEFKAMCEEALIKESASIKSKVRKIVKKIEKDVQ